MAIRRADAQILVVDDEEDTALLLRDILRNRGYHAEARAENPKDTRGLEQSYLARGQAQRVTELATGVAAVEALALRVFGPGDPVAMSALVSIEEEGALQHWFIAPAGGGNVLAGEVAVVTPSSPLGKALLGRRVDDEVEIRLPGRVRSLTITALA